MSRLLLSVALALLVGLGIVQAQEAPKKEPCKKPAAAKKEKPRKPLTPEQKAELAKKREAALAKMFEAKDKDKDGKLTLEEFKGKVKKPEVA